jgi:hypothetical protein
MTIDLLHLSIAIQFFPYSWLIFRYLTIVKRRTLLLTSLEYLNSSPEFSAVCVAHFLVFCAEFCFLLLVCLAIALSVRLWFMVFDYPFWHRLTFGHCSVCPSLIYGFWLSLWYHLAIVLYVLLWFTASDYLFGIFKLILHRVQLLHRLK